MPRKYLILFLVILFGISLWVRLYRIDNVPPALSWDEVAENYDAWSILHFGKDQWGQKYPLIFKSLGDYKGGFSIYTLALAQRVFGESEFMVRVIPAVASSISILIVFIIFKKATNSIIYASIGSIIFSLIPQSIQTSRYNPDVNLAYLFYLCGIFSFLFGLNKGKRPLLLILASGLFCLSLYTYNSFKVTVPLTIILLGGLFFKRLFKNFFAYLALSITIIFFMLLMLPQVSSTQRFNQVSIFNLPFEQTLSYSIFQNKTISQGEIFLVNYFKHLSISYLFTSGDANLRHSTQETGSFLGIDLVFLLIGIYFLTKQKQFLFIGLLVLSPIPSAITSEAPHAFRAVAMTFPWSFICASGIFYLYQKIPNIKAQAYFLVAVFLVYITYSYGFLSDYFFEYPKRSFFYWQYGVRETVLESQKFDYPKLTLLNDGLVFPYIYFLYYTKISPDEFLNSAKAGMNNAGYVQVSSIGKYRFEDFDLANFSYEKETSYIIHAPVYEILKEKYAFKIKAKTLDLFKQDWFILAERQI